MRTILAIGLMTLLLLPTVIFADRDDEREKWRERQEEWRERQEERAEEARERYEKQQKEWSKQQKKLRDHERKLWQDRGYAAPPRGPYVPYHYGYRPAPPQYRGYGYERPHRYPAYPEYRHHRHDDDDDDDDIDAIYTPWGFYEDYPRTPYDARRPRPEGRGQIGPFRFEVWK